MKRKPAFALLSLLSFSELLTGQVWAQGSPCVPAPQQPAQVQQAPRGQAGQAGQAGRGAAPAAAREVTAIPGIVAVGVQWAKVWQGAGNSADGILADKDGAVLVAQEDYDAVLKIDQNDKASVFVANAKGVGSLSMDRQGRLYGAHRTERPGSTKPDIASIVNAITILAPDRKTIAEKWADGTTLSARPNDLAADSQGGAFFTSSTGCLFYASADGKATVLDENIRSNGIIFSPDDKTLYVTNGARVVAFDVTGTGKLANRRDFGTLASGSGDGLAIDTEGRLYVTAGSSVQIFDNAGKYLGLIPTPRSVISVAFAGPNKTTLYVVGSGAEDANGQPIREGPQQTAATVYKLPMIARGVKDRAK